MRDEDQALHARLQQARDFRALRGRIGVAGDQEGGVVVATCRLLYPVEDLGEDGIVQVEDVYADRVRALTHQTARRAIRAISELIGRREDGLATRRRHLGRTLQRQRHEGLGDTGSCRDVVQRGSTTDGCRHVTRPRICARHGPLEPTPRRRWLPPTQRVTPLAGRGSRARRARSRRMRSSLR